MRDVSARDRRGNPAAEDALAGPPSPAGAGSRIRQLRLERGLSQEQIAGPGVSASYVSLIEGGRRQPTAKALEWLAAQLGSSVDYLAYGLADRSQELELCHAELELANGDASRAEQRFAALADARDPGVAGRARWGLAQSQEACGRLEEAIAAYEQLRADLPPGTSFLRCSISLSRCYREVGDLGRAVDVGEQALNAIAQYQLESSDLAIDALCTVAFAYQERGDAVRARQLLLQVRRRADALGDPRARGAAFWNASILAADAGHAADAVDLAYRALALFGEGADTRNLARLRNAYAALLMRSRPEAAAEAFELLEAAREVLLATGSAIDVAYCETEMSRALTLLHRPAEAQDIALSALERLGDSPRLESAGARLALAFALVAEGRLDEGHREYATAARQLGEMGARRQAGMAWAELSHSLQAAGELAPALEAAQTALAYGTMQGVFPPPHASGQAPVADSSRKRRSATSSRSPRSAPPAAERATT